MPARNEEGRRGREAEVGAKGEGGHRKDIRARAFQFFLPGLFGDFTPPAGQCGLVC